MGRTWTADDVELYVEYDSKKCADSDDDVLVPRSQVKARRARQWRDCTLCRGVGSTFCTDARGYDRAVDCDCRRLDKLIRSINRLRLPPKQVDADLETTQWDLKATEKIREPVRAFLEGWSQERRGMLLFGPPGTGKSRIAAAISLELVLRGHLVRWVTWQFLLEEMRACYGAEQPDWKVVQKYLDAELLVVDELKPAGSSEWVWMVLERVLGERLENNGCTIITANLDPRVHDDPASSLSAVVGDRVFSRLVEACALNAMIGDNFRFMRAAG